MNALVVSLALIAAQSSASDPAEPFDCADAAARFATALERWRHGDVSVREDLELGAQLLCDRCERCDARDVARYYLPMTPEQLARGQAAEDEQNEARGEVERARADDLATVPWFELREQVMQRLRDVIEGSRNDADFLPAAGAASGLARLAISRLESDRTIGERERAELIEEAAAALTQSLQLVERAGFVTPQIEPLWLRGRLLRLTDDRPRARDAFERCLELSRSRGRHDYETRALRGLITLARDAGDLPEEERLLLELARASEGADRWSFAREWTSWLLMNDRAEEALDFLEAREPEDPAERDEWSLLMVGASVRVGDLDEAELHLADLDPERDEFPTTLARAMVALRRDQPESVLELLEGFSDHGGWNALERAEVRVMRGEAALAIGDLGRASSELAQALELAVTWEARVLFDPLAASSDRSARDVMGEWIGLHAHALYADARLRMGQPLEAARALEEFQARSLREGTSELPALRALVGRAPSPLTTDDVRAWAAHFELGLVTWVIGPDFGVAVHVDPRGVASGERVELSRIALLDAARRLREATIAGNERGARKLARELGQRLLPARLRDELAKPSDPSRRILCVLHGALEGLPIELIEVAGEALEQRATVVCLPGLPESRPGSWNAAAPRAWHLLGAQASDEELALPQARRELEELSAVIPGARVAVGAAFTRDALVGALESGACVHVATHLVREGDGAGLRFAPLALVVDGGGRLSASAVRDLEPQVEIAVLSSCASAAGRFLDGEGLQGLSRAFLEARTRDVIATMWPVEDGAAREFALALHRGLQSGLVPSRAVGAARAELKRKGFHSADWAAFRILGRD